MPRSTSQPLQIKESVEVAASRAEVWAVVSDVRRMPEFSPELRRVLVRGAGVGARILALNRRGLVAWPTRSRVVRWEPERAVAWRTAESGATWTYEIEAAGHDRELARGIVTTLTRMKASIESAGS